MMPSATMRNRAPSGEMIGNWMRTVSDDPR
jgi:hypothetical protein